jgi:hypothetical protein
MDGNDSAHGGGADRDCPGRCVRAGAVGGGQRYGLGARRRIGMGGVLGRRSGPVTKIPQPGGRRSGRGVCELHGLTYRRGGRAKAERGRGERRLVVFLMAACE